MTATIIPLPGAAAAPVLTAKLGPGRPPSNVSSIRRGKHIRAIRKSWLDSADALEVKARGLRDAALKTYASADWAMREAASIEAQALQARQRGR
ncbi:hypothetical protein [[Acidovorax] ebreus]|uniref:hypothetical protein n=1 Tax=Diaphorobacter sp. LI3 TaxID=2952886 RepID=UPI00206D61CD|nr:hypothetical protein MRB47_07330 [Diaphorobacter sp. LI3]